MQYEAFQHPKHLGFIIPLLLTPPLPTMPPTHMYPTYEALLLANTPTTASTPFHRRRSHLSSESPSTSIKILQNATNVSSPQQPYTPTHPIRKAALTKPPISYIKVSMEILNDYPQHLNLRTPTARLSKLRRKPRPLRRPKPRSPLLQPTRTRRRKSQRVQKTSWPSVSSSISCIPDFSSWKDKSAQQKAW